MNEKQKKAFYSSFLSDNIRTYNNLSKYYGSEGSMTTGGKKGEKSAENGKRSSLHQKRVITH